MRKTWVKRENIYYKPFYKQKSKMLLLVIFLLGILFIAYQAFSINQLPNVSTPWTKFEQIRERHKQLQLSLGTRENEGLSRLSIGSSSTASNLVIMNEESPSDDPIKIIRGTRLFDYDAYKPNFDGNFKCLDGSKEIPFERVNDDYCDCLTDGSDEPSTNACINGKFYCKYQKRHITGRGQDVFIISSRINDGVCDCCDGSDEWTTSKCPKRCV